MSIQQALTLAALAAGLGGMILPALAQDPDSMRTMPGKAMGQMTEGGRAGHGMMSGRMMSRGMMSGDGCAGMMQSMNGGNGRPNSQWHSHPKGGATPD
jgi:hypothetical protein